MNHKLHAAPLSASAAAFGLIVLTKFIASASRILI
jgi:hypothetical protein